MLDVQYSSAIISTPSKANCANRNVKAGHRPRRPSSTIMRKHLVHQRQLLQQKLQRKLQARSQGKRSRQETAAHSGRQGQQGADQEARRSGNASSTLDLKAAVGGIPKHDPSRRFRSAAFPKTTRSFARSATPRTFDFTPKDSRRPVRIAAPGRLSRPVLPSRARSSTTSWAMPCFWSWPSCSTRWAWST